MNSSFQFNTLNRKAMISKVLSKNLVVCFVFLLGFQALQAQFSFPFSIPELPAGKQLIIQYKVVVNSVFNPLNTYTIIDQITLNSNLGMQNSDDPATWSRNSLNILKTATPLNKIFTNLSSINSEI